MPHLPAEVLTHIANHVPDRRTALSFSLASRACAGSCHNRLWRDLDLFLQSYYGEQPTICEYPPDSASHIAWSVRLGREADEAYGARLREVVRLLLGANSAKMWGAVENVRIVNRPGGIHSIIQMLDLVSPNVKTLAIDGPPILVVGRTQRLREHEMLDFAVIGAGLHFPALTELRLGHLCLRYLNLIPLLFNACPYLLSVYANFYDTGAIHNNEALTRYFPDYDGKTKIERLQIALNDTAVPNLEMLEYCPRLRQLSITGVDVLDSEDLDAISDMWDLRDLFLSATIGAFAAWLEEFEEDHLPCTQVETLVLQFEQWSDLLTELPQLPHLHTLYLDLPSSIPATLLDPAPNPNTNPVESMIPFLAASLRAKPHLRIIRTVRSLSQAQFQLHSDIFAPLLDPSVSTLVGTIRSIKHGESELLCARFFTNLSELADVLVGDEDGIADGRPVNTVSYPASDESRRLRIFEEHPRASWRTYTDHNDIAVPLEVIARMAEIEGLGEEWEGRGVEVRDEAWQVLLDWEEMRMPREAEIPSVVETDTQHRDTS